MDYNWESKYVQVDGVETHYIEAGDGDPVVLIHGGGASSCGPVNYGSVMEPMSKHFRVIAPDVIGFGKTSGRGPQDYSAQAHGDFLIKFLETLDLEAHVGGNSHGGWLAQYVAHEAPARVRRLIIINSLNGSMPIPGAPEGLKYIYGPLGHAHEEPELERTREQLKEFYFNEDIVTEERVQLHYQMAEQNYNFAKKRAKSERSTVKDANEDLAYKGAHIAEHAGDLERPVLLTWSRENAGASPADALSLYNRIDDVEMHIFSDARHHVQTEHPERWTEVVKAFLESDR